MKNKNSVIEEVLPPREHYHYNLPGHKSFENLCLQGCIIQI